MIQKLTVEATGGATGLTQSLSHRAGAGTDEMANCWLEESEQREIVPHAICEASRNRQEASSSGSQAGLSGVIMNQQQLQRCWDVAQRSTAEDWNEWLRRFSVELLTESPSPVLRSCAALAQAYTPLARELFHASFVSCWQELSEPLQENLINSLQTAFQSSTIPPDILQALLNLAEFMEHDVEALPINPSTLAGLAERSHAYAKALHYREMEFKKYPTLCFESLININKKLDQYDAALGVLKVAYSCFS